MTDAAAVRRQSYVQGGLLRPLSSAETQFALIHENLEEALCIFYSQRAYQRMESFSLSQRCWEPRVSKAPQKEPRNLGAFVVQSAASDIDEPEVPLHSPHQ
jgi:hypothetical protein